MSDEEKQAIEFIKSELQDEKKVRNDYQSLTGLYGNLEIEIILNLIEKQSKEIEELKTINQMQKYRIEVIDERELISKDKIKAKIEEIENEDKKYKNYLKDGRENFTPEYVWARPVLQSLLEKE